MLKPGESLPDFSACHNHGFNSVTVDVFKESGFHILGSRLIFASGHGKLDTLKIDALIDVDRPPWTYQTCLPSPFAIPLVSRLSWLVCIAVTEVQGGKQSALPLDIS